MNNLTVNFKDLDYYAINISLFSMRSNRWDAYVKLWRWEPASSAECLTDFKRAALLFTGHGGGAVLNI